MDGNGVSVIDCLYSDASHNTPPNPGVWKSMSGVLGNSVTNTAPSVAGDITTGLYSPAAGQVGISTVGIGRLIVDQNGNVGINTLNPQSPLEITSPFPLIGSMGIGVPWGDFWYDGGTDGYYAIENTSMLDTGGTGFNRNPGFSGNITHLLYIGNSGNVGVGTESPQATLDVIGFTRLSLNSSAPAACSGLNAGAIALTHTAHICTCDGSQWNLDSNGAACAW
jgi:hypothetical protein